MLFYNFKDYEGFKERFGITRHGNGNKSRRNKILLSYIKDPRWIKISHHNFSADFARQQANLDSMAALYNALVKRAADECAVGEYPVYLLDFRLWSDKVRLDDYNGICEDGDTTAVRYVNVESGRVYKKKAGRLLRDIMMESDFGESLPEPVMKWLCEEFNERWQTHASSTLPNYTLHVGNKMSDFERIYSGRACKGYFGSCMTNEGYHTFYVDAVKARAAYLENEDGQIVSRCVIYDDVKVEDTGELLRLAERQYSTDGNILLMRLLVDKLIKAGEIDGYKKVGADCHSPMAFVRNDGTPLDVQMSIACNLDHGDTVSYQDSFKWYDMYARRADNYGHGDIGLESTDGRMEDDEDNYDEYHDEYTSSDVITVYYHGREITCAEDALDDFIYVNYDYYHMDDVVWSDFEQCNLVEEDAYYSDVTCDYYSSQSDMRDDELDYYHDNGYAYSEYDDEWFADSDDVVKIILSDGNETTISVYSIRRHFPDAEYDEEREVYVEKED